MPYGERSAKVRKDPAPTAQGPIRSAQWPRRSLVTLDAEISRHTLLVRGERGFTSNLGLSTGAVCRRANCLLLDVEIRE